MFVFSTLREPSTGGVAGGDALPPVLAHVAATVGDLTRCGECRGQPWVFDGHEHGEEQVRPLMGVRVMDTARKSPRMQGPPRFGVGDFFVIVDTLATELVVDTFDQLAVQLADFSSEARRDVAEYLAGSVFCELQPPVPSGSDTREQMSAAGVILCVIEDRNYPGYWRSWGGFYLPARALIAVANSRLRGSGFRALGTSNARNRLDEVDPVLFGVCGVCGREHDVPQSVLRA